MVICKISRGFPNSPFNQVAPLQNSVLAMYSTSVVDNATTVNKIDFQLIAKPPIIKTYLVRS